MTYTYTYAILEVDQATYEDVRGRLLAAGYGHALHQHGPREVIDMHGIALAVTNKSQTGLESSRGGSEGTEASG